MPRDPFETEETEGTTPTGGLPKTVEELIEILLSFPRDNWGNIITPRGAVSLTGLIQFFQSPVGRQYFASLLDPRVGDPMALQAIVSGDLSKLPIKIPRMKSGMEIEAESYAEKLKDKRFIQRFLESAGVGDISQLSDYQLYMLSSHARGQAESEGAITGLAKGYRTGQPFAGYQTYEEYALARGLEGQEAQPREAFATGGGMATREWIESAASEIGLTQRFQQAKALGIDLSKYEINPNQPKANLEMNLLNVNYALVNEMRRVEESRRIAGGQRAMAEYPQFIGEWQKSRGASWEELATPQERIGQPAAYLNWLEKLPAYGELTKQREQRGYERYPQAWGAYKGYLEETPMATETWSQWLEKSPVWQSYVKTQEGRFMEAQGEARRRIAPRARWIL